MRKRIDYRNAGHVEGTLDDAIASAEELQEQMSLRGFDDVAVEIRSTNQMGVSNAPRWLLLVSATRERES